MFYCNRSAFCTAFWILSSVLLAAQGGNRPDSRDGFVYTYDSDRNRIVLFGGHNGSYRGDTWEWDGRQWHQGASGPSPRVHGAMVYDPARRRTVMFGGYRDEFLADTWEWDGALWTNAGQAGPPNRALASSRFDSVSGRVVVENGYNGTMLRDSWSWDGRAWSQSGTGTGLGLQGDRLTPWQAGVDGGIPDSSGWPVIVATDAPYNAVGDGVTNNRDALRSAIDAAAQSSQPTVVYLPAGDYYYTDGNLKLKSNVVLRGEGQGATRLIYHLAGGHNQPMIDTEGSALGGLDIVGGVERGSSMLTLEAAPGWSAGDWISIRLQENPPYIDNPIRTTSDFITQMVQIASVDGVRVGLKTPLYLDFELRYLPHAKLLSVTENAGLENLSVSYTNNSLDKWVACVRFQYAANSWMYDCEVERGGRHSVRFRHAARNEIRRCHFHDYVAAIQDGSTYSIVVGHGAHDNLISDTIIRNVPIAVILQYGCSGNVFAYNYCRDLTLDNNHGIFFHGTYPHSNLIEGNDIKGNITLDNFWGQQGPRNTIFRNRVQGSGDDVWNSAFGIRTHQDRLSAISSFANIVGNSTYHMLKVPFCRSMRDCFDFDQLSTEMWIERNLIRRAFKIETPEPTTTTLENFVGDSAPASWSGQIPPTLLSSVRPEWWPNGKAWPATGADVDDYRTGAVRVKLPAQDRFER